MAIIYWMHFWIRTVFLKKQNQFPCKQVKIMLKLKESSRSNLEYVCWRAIKSNMSDSELREKNHKKELYIPLSAKLPFHWTNEDSADMSLHAPCFCTWGHFVKDPSMGPGNWEGPERSLRINLYFYRWESWGKKSFQRCSDGSQNLWKSPLLVWPFRSAGAQLEWSFLTCPV